MFQFNIVFGILIALLFSALLAGCVQRPECVERSGAGDLR